MSSINRMISHGRLVLGKPTQLKFKVSLSSMRSYPLIGKGGRGSINSVGLTLMRSFITSTSTRGEDKLISQSPLPAHYQLVYMGPLAKTARYLKLFSISSLVMTVSLSPLIFFIDAGLSTVVRTILFGAALGTSGLSTALIHWCIHPYVTRCWVDTRTLSPASNPLSPPQVQSDTQFCLENLNLLGKVTLSNVDGRDFAPSTRLFTTHSYRTTDNTQGLCYFHLDVAEQNHSLNQLLNLSSGKLDALRSAAGHLSQTPPPPSASASS